MAVVVGCLHQRRGCGGLCGRFLGLARVIGKAVGMEGDAASGQTVPQAHLEAVADVDVERQGTFKAQGAPEISYIRELL